MISYLNSSTSGLSELATMPDEVLQTELSMTSKALRNVKQVCVILTANNKVTHESSPLHRILPFTPQMDIR